MQETAYAKVNLALHVRAREPDGYHRIETVFAFAEEGDALGVAAAESLSLTVIGPFADALAGEGDNLVLRAARALAEHCDVRTGAAITLDKRLPIASGIGGGSADAATTLRLLRRFWTLDVDDAALHTIAAKLGADVPACLHSRTMFGRGRGDILEPLDLSGLAGTPLLLVNPRVPVSTAAVFRAWDGIDRGPLAGWEEGRNDLEPPARMLVPEIDAVLQALSKARVARMSGSGATCFGLFDCTGLRDACAAEIAHRQQGWWMLPTRIR
ncbi:4-(cytidine 5'-diphospho)-2-C-methyl-D-erythritol kinase [Sphingosinicella sp. LHD-64]|uniref:4-(cytidine 5'-diphospho)-2-C-methyl-D-erythritol kinase n=1 Tax=Sphingosinicella sp. LHD-64 TaxID=3072139 RepID=UPI00280D8F25|nr:4-(cytidine 5'-diphospho)-2-C-methyl-D-erythritol kinase [Sphingosinicella sp. LHD-64]MDQ8755245.1 4-(cytidine 5'-diphospho)-2-C-methyl-D-erythritol kinase [Sphingosinicella sp. LHD-64]